MTSEYLGNLVKIGQLDEVPASRELGLRILATARTRLTDAGIVQASNETRFDCAYTCIRAVGDLGLLLNGLRTSTSRPGHHMATIQTLKHTLGVDDATIRVLDGLRKQRNLAGYDGDLVTDVALAECLRQANDPFGACRTAAQGRGMAKSRSGVNGPAVQAGNPLGSDASSIRWSACRSIRLRRRLTPAQSI
jgi:hypothetical protein